jgi:hypothetical protein
MKKKVLIITGIISILAMLALAVTPVAAAGEKSITFLGAQLIPGKGVVFEFNVVGEFSDLSGFVKVGGQQFGLSCHFNGKGNLACMASQGLSRYLGQVATGSINGYNFSGLIRGFCYSVYDYYPNPLPENWGEIGKHCQKSPASPGDIIQFHNPDYPSTPFWNYGYSLGYYFVCGPV